jgi:hypothetical protein
VTIAECDDGLDRRNFTELQSRYLIESKGAWPIVRRLFEAINTSLPSQCPSIQPHNPPILPHFQPPRCQILLKSPRPGFRAPRTRFLNLHPTRPAAQMIPAVLRECARVVTPAGHTDGNLGVMSKEGVVVPGDWKGCVVFLRGDFGRRRGVDGRREGWYEARARSARRRCNGIMGSVFTSMEVVD